MPSSDGAARQHATNDNRSRVRIFAIIIDREIADGGTIAKISIIPCGFVANVVNLLETLLHAVALISSMKHNPGKAGLDPVYA